VATNGQSPVILDVRGLEVHYALRGSFLQRLTGLELGAVKAVDGVTFQLRRGEVLGLVGESGSGKTTLGRAILHLTRATKGALVLNGHDVTHLSERDFRPFRREVQMIFQDPRASLNPSMTLLEAVGHPLRIHGVTRDPERIRRRVSDALERVGLTPVDQFLAKYPADLSGGQNQRAALARAIILGPQLLVADEPVSMLDMSVRAKVLELMLGIKREFELTYLYITHDLATAKFFCDRIAIMYLGRIVEIGPSEEIYAQPRHPYTVSLLKAIPEPDPNKQVGRDLPRGEIPDAARPPLGCSFHPRCPKAFAPCGWETRDLRFLLEQRWAALDYDAYQAELNLVGDIDKLASSTVKPRLHAAGGHPGEELLAYFQRMRADNPSEPLWRGVNRLDLEGNAVAIDFHEGVAPPLQPVASGVEVACHLYDERFTPGAARGAPRATDTA
jgi:oligopeptide/dipeptide ABC transporter ATP-binding protein